ncbi:MAG: response regulator [Oscillospiraceae bacterium]|nr:response regulator [Oscillospiraceae bacterium]
MSSRGFSKPLILAVDNAAMFLSTLKRLLEGEPYELHCESSGDDALRFLDSNRPDLILMDIEMPDIDGYELARQIKRKGHRAPILFITANSDKEYAERAEKEGAAGLLIKPLRRNQLMEKIREFT